jgi:O-acetyl-ADP-ribose deacetylase (regulator of RNase III)
MSEIECGLVDLLFQVKSLKIKSIAIPPLGCGNGRLSWSDVKPRIEAAFEELPEVNVKLFAPHG